MIEHSITISRRSLTVVCDILRVLDSANLKPHETRQLLGVVSELLDYNEMLSIPLPRYPKCAV